MTDYVGQKLGNYRLIRLVGKGSFAEVYLGEHIHLSTQAAIKVLHTHLTSDDVDNFRNEARIIARLIHPHIVRVIEFGVEGKTPFLVMDYAPHGTLRQRHPKGTGLPLDTVVSYVKQLADALQYAHEKKLVHRDIKQENMLLVRFNEVLLSDFGLAIIAQSSYSQQVQDSAGTVAYMAPEHIQGHPCPASDQYALGIVVYEWLSGDRPFHGSTLEIATQHLFAPPPPLQEKVPTIPSAVERVVLQALAKDPKLRFAQVQSFALALEEANRTELTGRTLPMLFTKYESETGHLSKNNLPTRTVTLLFPDIEGLTRWLQESGQGYPGILVECRLLLRAIFQQWHGYEVDTQGDSFFVAFARATDAISAAVDVQRALATHAWPKDVTLRVRMGLHTGEPSVASEGYIGSDVNLAARIMSAGYGGQVILSQTTGDLIEHNLPTGVSLRDLGEHRLKDLRRPKRLFQLVIEGLTADFPPLKTLDARPNNLPIQFTSLIGREKEVAAVQNLLSREDIRLLTLTGPGGTGKTRLGLQVAAELNDSFADGVFFVNLASISDPDLVMPTIAETLELKETGDQPLLDLLKAYLREKHLLLLLDNFEQVVGAAMLVADLLTACPKLKVLVTSRVILRMRAEKEFAVPPLALPDLKRLPDLVALSQYEALALFVLRARAVKPEFQMTDANAPFIAGICARLDGLPLAIELAAARIKLLPPHTLLARLGQRLQVLTSGGRDVPARQQTLRNTMEWSYNLLDAQEQQLFRRLSVFAGGCTLEAIESVCMTLDSNADQVLDAVASLVDKNLLQQREKEEGDPRLVMLETIHEYGLECLAASGETVAIWQAHAEYYLILAEKAELEFRHARPGVWLELLGQEHENLRAALSWFVKLKEAEKALRLGAALAWFWVACGYLSEGRQWVEKALTESEGVAAYIRGKGLNAAGILACSQGDYRRAATLGEESLTLFRELADQRGIALSLNVLGYVARLRGDYAAARSMCEESLAIFRQEEDKWNIAETLYYLASMATFQGDLATARTLITEDLMLFREMGDQRGIAYALNTLGLVSLLEGDAETARLQQEESFAICKALGDRLGIAFALSALGGLELLQGNYVAARTMYEESLAIAIQSGDKWLTAVLLEGFGRVVAAQGLPGWAVRLWSVAHYLREAIGTPLSPIERAVQEHSMAVARIQLGGEMFEATWAEGRTMTLEQALTAQGQATISIAQSSTPPAKSPATFHDGLTTREIEVLRLVAQGLTNEQVAQQLVISPRTVNTHLTSIYGKIGVNSRSAATRYAIEHRFVKVEHKVRGKKG
jgi:predicted ATPase/serine/threonine protein kinase/DNA-binding CsgD family transcriptional regulator